MEPLLQLVESDDKAVNGAGSAVLISILIHLLSLRIVAKGPRGGVVSRLSMVGSSVTPPSALRNHYELWLSRKALLAMFRWSNAVKTAKTLWSYIVVAYTAAGQWA
jgi:hypothetical protein